MKEIAASYKGVKTVMGHSHSHSHSHNHGHNVNKRALRISFFLIASYMIIEVVGGMMTNSLALLSDAGHMLSDAAALGLSYLATTFGERKANKFKTYGYKRIEILAAFINGLTLIGISIYIFWEAYNRFLQPPSIMSSGMFIVSVIGFIVNMLAAFILLKGDTSENLNIRSAFLHVLGDLLGSAGAITASLLIMFFGWNIADPFASVFVAVLIIISACRVTRDATHILMEGAPSNIDVAKVQKTLEALKNVIGVHDLHVWSISSDMPSLSCHIVVKNEQNSQTVLQEAKKVLHEKFDIHHSTIQIDTEDNPCEQSGHCN